MKNVQIPQELFMKLLRYHLLDDDSCTEDVKKELEQKMKTMVEREGYTCFGDSVFWLRFRFRYRSMRRRASFSSSME